MVDVVVRSLSRYTIEDQLQEYYGVRGSFEGVDAEINLARCAEEATEGQSGEP